ncbi:MAG: hypothetical protein ABI882_13555 [Acidobacteriota bacterium]
MVKWRPISLLLLLLAYEVASAQQTGVRLPTELSEEESHQIVREGKSKSHVEAAFKVSVARLTQALEFAKGSQYRESAQNLDVYAELVNYADSYARRTTNDRSKDRHSCLKTIEQQIFKQNMTLETIVRELPATYQDTTDRVTSTLKRIRLRAIDDLLGGGSFLKSSTDTPD